MTLDQALDKFDAKPSRRTAETVSAIAAMYCDDGMIADDTYEKILARVRPYLTIVNSKL